MKPRELEELALTTWPALQQWLYDGWVVRFADGHTRRANSVTPLYPARHDPAAKLAQCEQWYAAANLPTVFRLNRHTAPAAIDRLLDARGYRLVDPSLTLHRRLDEWTLPGDLRGTLRSETLPDWLALYCRLSGKALDQQRTHTMILQATPPTRIFASLWDHDHAVACAVGVAVVAAGIVAVAAVGASGEAAVAEAPVRAVGGAAGSVAASSCVAGG